MPHEKFVRVLLAVCIKWICVFELVTVSFSQKSLPLSTGKHFQL